MTPFELAARYLVPNLRAVTARRLLEGGMSQNEAARRLGVSQPMVRKYAAGAREAVEELARMGIPREAVDAIAGALADAAARGYWEHVSAMNSIVASILRGGSLCAFHRRIDPRVPEGCSLCSEVLMGGSDQYVEDVGNALSLLT
ncbi:MAG: transcriptional regulator, partial [Conexivisphaera sp.]